MGPLIRQEDEYAAMSRPMRGKILDRMMTFIRKADFQYHCLSVDTKFINTSQQIFEQLKTQLTDFIRLNHSEINALGKIKIYYDAGQKPVSKLLERSLPKMSFVYWNLLRGRGKNHINCYR